MLPLRKTTYLDLVLSRKVFAKAFKIQVCFDSENRTKNPVSFERRVKKRPQTLVETGSRVGWVALGRAAPQKGVSELRESRKSAGGTEADQSAKMEPCESKKKPVQGAASQRQIPGAQILFGAARSA